MSADKPFPIPQYGQASITCPKQYVDYIISKKQINLPPIPAYCFIVYSTSLIDNILAAYPHRMIDIGSRNPTRIYFCNPGKASGFAVIGEQLGASMSAVVLEELIALGFSKFIATGTTGHPCLADEKKLSIGDFLIVDEALIFEGTSPHYMPGQSVSTADSDLCVQAGKILDDLRVDHRQGRIATTDALYRETARFLDSILQSGAVAVDMETSALYTVARFHGRQICAVLYVSDIVVIDNDWQTEVVSGAMDRCESVFLEFIGRIVEDGRGANPYP